MTELEKLHNGLLADYRDEEIQKILKRTKSLLPKFNSIAFRGENYREVLKELIPDIPESSNIVPPFYCDFGTGIHIGEHVFINFNCTMLDNSSISIGNHTLIGPNCQFYCPQHPMNYRERREPKEHAFPIKIGDDCWLGGGVIVCPGVTIGNRCIIAAGSVVIEDIPDDSLAAGNPAKVKRKLNQ